MDRLNRNYSIYLLVEQNKINMKILIFKAIWCKDCKFMNALWRNLQLEMPELEIKYFEIDDHKEYCDTFSIFTVPTVIFADREGKELERIDGIVHRDIVLDLIKKYKNL